MLFWKSPLSRWHLYVIHPGMNRNGWKSMRWVRKSRKGVQLAVSFLRLGRAQQPWAGRTVAFAQSCAWRASLLARGRGYPCSAAPLTCSPWDLHSLKQWAHGCLGVCLPFFLSFSSKGLIFSCGSVIKAFISVITVFKQCKQEHRARQWFVYFFMLVFQVNTNTSLLFGLYYGKVRREAAWVLLFTISTHWHWNSPLWIFFCRYN